MNEGTRQQQSPIKEQGPKSELKACRQSRQIRAVGTIYRIQSLLNHDRLERRYPPISSHLQTWNAFPVLLQSCWLQQRSGSGFTFENTNLQGQQVETLHIDSSSLSGSWHHFPFSAQRVGRKANLTRSWTVLLSYTWTCMYGRHNKTVLDKQEAFIFKWKTKPLFHSL